jgi:hypothetical protein
MCRIGWVALTGESLTGRLCHIRPGEHDAEFQMGSPPLPERDVLGPALLEVYGLNQARYMRPS